MHTFRARTGWRSWWWIGLAALAVPAASAQPYINYRGVVNAASFLPPGVPAGALARGATVSIFGANIGPATSPALAFPLQTTLGGVSIAIRQGTTEVAAIPVFVSPRQVNAIVPSNAPLGSVSMQLTYNGVRSNPVPLVVAASAFGIFSVSAGSGPGIVQNFVSPAVQPINSLIAPAAPNQVVTLWGTGLGAGLNPDNQAPQAGDLPVQTEVFVGGVPARLSYKGRSPCCAGIDQIVFTVPADAPLGCWVPVFVRTGGVTVSNAVTMAIAPEGAASCTEPGNALAGPLLSGGRTARYLAARVAVHHDVAVARTTDTVADLSTAYLARETASPFAFEPAVSAPPPGSCTVYSYARDFSANGGLPPALPDPVAGARALDAGPTAIAPQSTNAGFVHDTSGGATYFGASVPTLTPLGSNLFLNPGGFFALAGGGAAVEAFAARFTMPPPLTWTNRDALRSLTRSQGFTANWSAVSPGHSVFVTGGGADLPNNASTVFFCTARPGETSLTVPPYVLANIPATRANAVQSRGFLYLGQWPLSSPATIQAGGLDTGFVVPMQVLGRTVIFQ